MEGGGVPLLGFRCSMFNVRRSLALAMFNVQRTDQHAAYDGHTIVTEHMITRGNTDSLF